MRGKEIKSRLNIIALIVIIVLLSSVVLHYYFIYKPNTLSDEEKNRKNILGTWYRIPSDNSYKLYDFHKNGSFSVNDFEKSNIDENISYNIVKNYGTWSVDGDSMKINGNEIDIEGELNVYSPSHPNAKPTFVVDSSDSDKKISFSYTEGFKSGLKEALTGFMTTWKNGEYELNLKNSGTYTAKNMYPLLPYDNEWQIVDGDIVFSKNEGEIRVDMYLGKDELKGEKILILIFPERGKMIFT